MTLIQVLLTVPLVALVYMVLRAFRLKQLTPLAVIGYTAVICLGLVVIIFPATASIFAQFLGVGRGSDAILYLLNVLVLIVLVRTHVRLEKLDFVITRLVRNTAYDEYKKKHESGD